MGSVYVAGATQAVDTGDTYFDNIAKLPISARPLALEKLAIRPILITRPLFGGKPFKARIEYARYVVDCPNCGNAEFAFEDKLFLCSICNNSDVAGQIRRVIMPPQRKEIEKALGKRKIINRHWNGETVEQLEKENLDMGVE